MSDSLAPGGQSTAGANSFNAYNKAELIAGARGGVNAEANYGQAPGQEAMVWMGPAYERRGLPKRGGGSTGMLPISVAANEFGSWGPEEMARWQDFTQATMGFVPGENSAQGLLTNVLIGLAQYQTTTGEKIDLWQYMERRKKLYGETQRKRSGGGGGVGPRSVVNLTNPQDAEVLVDNALTSYLGRQATEEELSEFLKTLNRQQRKNPVVVSQAGQTGGVNEQLIAEEFAAARPEAAETQAATTYMGWMMDALTGDETGGIQSGL